jgi:hypothetical protein
MTTAPVQTTLRQPLNLPAGSIRGILALMVFGLVWALMLLPEDRSVQIPVYLYYLMFLVLGHFFAAHGHSISGPRTGHSHPLYLPRGTLPILIIGGFVGVLAYRYYVYQDVNKLFVLSEPMLSQAYLPLALLGSFFLGIIVGRLLGHILSGPQGPPPWFHDVQSWVALISGLALAADIIVQFIINPTLVDENKIQWQNFQAALASVIAFYFGARS